MSDASVPSNFFHFRGEEGQLERGGPREDGTLVGRIQPGHFSFLRLMAVEIWAFYVCTNGGTCEVSCWFCVPVFEANIGAQWWNCGKMWDGGRWGKKVWIVSRWWRGRREVGERVAALNIFPFEIIDRAYHLGVVLKDQLIVRSCGWEISLNFASL